MYVVGVRFERVVEARAALAELRDRFGLGPGEADVRPLGSTEYGEPNEAHLLAGRFEDHAVAEVMALVRRRGGVIVELRTDDPSPIAVIERPPDRELPRGWGRSPTRSSRAVRARAPRPRRVNR